MNSLWTWSAARTETLGVLALPDRQRRLDRAAFVQHGGMSVEPVGLALSADGLLDRTGKSGQPDGVC